MRGIITFNKGSMEIKDRIRMIMEREKVPPRVFAETIGVQQSTLSHILNDRNKPSLEVVMKVHQTYSYVHNRERMIFDCLVICSIGFQFISV